MVFVGDEALADEGIAGSGGFEGIEETGIDGCGSPITLRTEEDDKNLSRLG